MNEEYITYEYKSINVKTDLEQMYIDCYKNFGWIPVNNIREDYYINDNPNPNLINIKFKRNRKIQHRETLNKLQEKYEQALLKVNKLENEPNLKGLIYSMSLGIVASIFLTISIFSATGEKTAWFLAIFCGIIGIIGCIMPYFIYKNTKTKSENENKTKIEEQYNIMYDICEQVKKILIEG